MKFEIPGRVEPLEAVAPGTAFVGRIGEIPTLCLKVFFRDEDGRAVTKIVALAPGLDAYDGRPGIIDPEMLSAPAVLTRPDLRIAVSPQDWSAVTFVDTGEPESAGTIVLSGDRAYLKFLQGAAADSPVELVDLESGEISRPGDRAYQVGLTSWVVAAPGPAEDEILLRADTDESPDDEDA